MGLIQRGLEAAGIACVSLTLLRSVTEVVKPGKSLYVEFPFGLTFGDVGDDATHRDILSRMLEEALTERSAGHIEGLPHRWTKNDLRIRMVGEAGV